jgi:hypothetical protein
MKAKIITAVIGVAALVSGFFVGRFDTGRQWNQFFMNFIYTDTSNDAHSHVRTLTALREGRQTNAVEILENVLDGELLTYITFEELRPEKRSEAGLRAIRVARDYRAKHPWQSSSAEINDGVQRVFALVK